MSATDSPPNIDETNGGGPVDRLRGLAAVAAAVLVLIGFAGLLAYLIGQVDNSDDTAWSRYLYLFGAAEAIVFTAVGWLFGQEVNCKAADQASERADAATSKAEDASILAAGQTAKGEALRAGIEARAGIGVEERGGLGDEGGSGSGAPTSMQDLAVLARSLFP